ncbi:MAG: protein kinase [Planctomycetaceae bacterium]|nr:protein kinase [Planctomycetaceae bacterium]
MRSMPCHSARKPATTSLLSNEAEGLLLQFEREWSNSDNSVPSINRFLLDINHVQRPVLLEELLRVDLEFRHSRHLPYSVEDYLDRFPELLEQPAAVARIRAEAERQVVLTNRNNPSDFPEPHAMFLGFQLIGILGKGAFGQVYLARQDDLARRLVALKVTRGQNAEAQRLARLQHTNIVPVFSVHQEGGLQAICMPFLGIMTLADLLSESQRFGSTRSTGRELIQTIADYKAKTLPDLVSPKLIDFVPQPSTSSSETRYFALGDRAPFQSLAWIWQQLAEGLDYAHSLGIVHGDIKPANVLISDAGRPLLLDFNLATSQEDGAIQAIGGTLPYMSAEHLRCVKEGGIATPDSDLYSLAIVFFELLTGKRPFSTYAGSFDDQIERLIHDRRTAIAPIRQLAPQLPIDLAAIVDKCLSHKVEQRYPSAAAIAEDLGCFLNRKPLRFAPNRSLKVRSRNWCFHHPRLMSGTSVALCAIILLAGLTIALVTGQQQLTRWENQASIERWNQQLLQARLPLLVVDLPSAQVDVRATALLKVLEEAPQVIKAWEASRNISDQANSLANESWLDDVVASRLTLAGAWLRTIANVENSEERQLRLTAIETQHEWLTSHIDGVEEAPAFGLQKSRYAELVGDASNVDTWRKSAMTRPAISSIDRRLLANEWYMEGNIERAISELQSVIQDDPLDAEAWLILGNSHAAANNLPSAEASYSVCIGLDANSAIAWYNRGRVRYDLGNYKGALDDYSHVVELDPQDPAAFGNRALIYMEQQDWHAAERDLSRAIECPGSEARLLHLRAQVYHALKLTSDAERDLETFLQSEPEDEESLLTRGVLRLQRGDQEGGLLDFYSATRRFPNSATAWNNISAILANSPEKTAASIEAMKQVIEIEPRNATAHATLAVLLARTGERTLALEIASQALALDSSPDTQYRIAGVYAQTSVVNPGDGQEAMRILASVAKISPELVLQYWDRDPDLAPLATSSDIRRLREALQTIEDLTLPASNRTGEHHE